MLPILWAPSASPYQYELYSPLGSQSGAFRLIRLLPPIRTVFGKTLRIEIITVDDASARAYNALSYTWGVTGKDPPDRRIIVETPQGPRELYIYRPLEIALNSITTGRPLFVDQICINQDDDEEKAIQVQMMRDIYTKCTQLIVWLGPGTSFSDAFFNFVRQINEEGILSRVTRGTNNQHFMQVFDAVMDPNLRVEGKVQQDRDGILMLLSKYGESYPLKGAEDVLRRQWFHRLWTIQEICLAPTVLLVCGSQNICFECFRMGLLFYNIYSTHWVNNVKKAIPEPEVQLRDDLLALNASPIRIFRERKAIHQTGTRRSLYDVVVQFNVNAKDPKIGASLAEDRIYGLMGMAETRSLAGVKVHYDDTRKVFMEFATLLASKNLDILLFSQFPKNISTLPSWVPDWSMDINIPRGYRELNQPSHNAGGYSRGEPIVNYDTGCLTVRGILIDIIVKVGQYELAKEEESRVVKGVDFRSVRNFLAEIDEFLAQSRVTGDLEMASIHLADAGISGKNVTEGYGNTTPEGLRAIRKQAIQYGQKLIDLEESRNSYHISRIVRKAAHIPWFWVPASETDALQLWAVDPISAFKAWASAAGLFLCDLVGIFCISSFMTLLLPKYLQLRRRWRGFQFHNVDQPDLVRRAGIDPDFASRKTFSEYSESLTRNIGQRLYLTEKNYIGTGPARMQPGDAVAVLFGMTVPVVLRKHTSSGEHVAWSYLDEAYCYGVMDGEILQDGEETSFNLI